MLDLTCNKINTRLDDIVINSTFNQQQSKRNVKIGYNFGE